MNKHLYRAAAVVGLLAVGWVAAGYLRSNPLALVMTLLIAAFYVMGALELQRYQQTTAALNQALQGLHEPPASLTDWLGHVPAALRNAVRLRVAGERSPLPGPALTPYLAGLLVLLGMLGTFLGMVVTLNGTGLALEHATDVQTMRDSLAAPVRGLGLAFGTSVAGVAASAMLGLMSALCRQARQQAGLLLDTHIAGALQGFTRAHQLQVQRDAALQQEQLYQQQQRLHQEQLLLHQAQQLQLQQQQAVQAEQQARQLPQLVAQLQGLMTQLAQQSQQSNGQLLGSQQRFQAQAEEAYRRLAESVDQTLQRSLSDSARVAADTLQPAVQATLAGITRETAALHGHIAGTVQQQLDGLATRFEAQSTRWVDAVGAQMSEQSAALLTATAATLQRGWQQAGEQTLAQQAQICATLEQTAGRISAQAEAHARGTVAEVARLVQTASEAPRAAADVVAQLREKLSDSLARDNSLLEERSRIMDTLHTLLGAVQHTSTEQKAAIDQLVSSTAAWLEHAGARFTQKVDDESARLQAVSAQISASAVDVASLGEAFGVAVDLFSQSSRQMVAQLERVEDALGKSTTRSDEQLAYYVAQAREVIDLSLLSQKQIVDDLQRLARQQAAASEA